MRRPVAFAASLGLVAALASSGWGSPSPRKPVLSLVDLNPVVVRGQNFKRAERVVVTLRTDGARARTRVVRATRAGAFRIRFGEVAVDRCSAGIGVTAVGGRGSRAAAKAPQPDCPPSLGLPDG